MISAYCIITHRYCVKLLMWHAFILQLQNKSRVIANHCIPTLMMLVLYTYFVESARYIYQLYTIRDSFSCYRDSGFYCTRHKIPSRISKTSFYSKFPNKSFIGFLLLFFFFFCYISEYSNAPDIILCRVWF